MAINICNCTHAHILQQLSTLPHNKEGYTMADQTNNEISHVQSVNKGREHVRKQINSDFDVETQVAMQKREELVGVEEVKKEIHLFFTTPLDQLK